MEHGQKKIAILKSDLAKRGGLEKYTHRLAESFAKSGHQVFLLTTGYPEDAPQAAYQVVNVGKKRFCSFFHLLSFNKKCAE